MSSSKAPGLFITFEGIDGAGKTTHIDATVAAFVAQGHVVCQTRDPGGTPVGGEGASREGVLCTKPAAFLG